MRWLLLILLLAAPGRAGAAAPPPFADALPWERLAGAHPGDWAEYVVHVGGHPVGPWLRLLVVGPGAGGTWVEIWISQRPGSATQAYRLLLGDRGGVRRVVARLLGGQSREMPPPAAAPTRKSSAPTEWTRRGEEVVQTEAGSLRAEATESWSGGERIACAWFAPEVPVLGLVRLDLAGGSGLELHRWGRGGNGVVEVPDPPPPREAHADRR
ncbi:hypothetical protein [Vulgatibacter sp.]|uniref:hypothetical protein n=1 Tax=Vulgatibacter sp. TaxID=1971226 RepID=UPI003569C399